MTAYVVWRLRRRALLLIARQTDFVRVHRLLSVPGLSRTRSLISDKTQRDHLCRVSLRQLQLFSVVSDHRSCCSCFRLLSRRPYCWFSWFMVRNDERATVWRGQVATSKT